VNRLNWQCCLAGSSKTAPKILIFSMTIGADYSFELISLETCVSQFIGHNKSFLGSVSSLCMFVLSRMLKLPFGNCLKPSSLILITPFRDESITFINYPEFLIPDLGCI
jgi:hypothetical protein